MARKTLIVGDSDGWEGSADFVITHPYAPITLKVPCILNYVGKRVGRPIGEWGKRNYVYVRDLPHREIDLTDLVEDGEDRGCGFMPLELPRRLIKLYSDFLKPDMLVWDGFCGRGTIGKACLEAGLRYIGIDMDPARIELAREYLATS